MTKSEVNHIPCTKVEIFAPLMMISMNLGQTHGWKIFVIPVVNLVNNGPVLNLTSLMETYELNDVVEGLHGSRFPISNVGFKLNYEKYRNMESCIEPIRNCI